MIQLVCSIGACGGSLGCLWLCFLVSRVPVPNRSLMVSGKEPKRLHEHRLLIGKDELDCRRCRSWRSRRMRILSDCDLGAGHRSQPHSHDGIGGLEACNFICRCLEASPALQRSSDGSALHVLVAGKDYVSPERLKTPFLAPSLLLLLLRVRSSGPRCH